MMNLNEAVTSKMTLKNLLDNYTKLYDSKVQTSVVSSTASEDKAHAAKTFTAKIRSASGGTHPVTVKLGKDPSGKYSLGSPCKVDCDCKTYVFRNNAPLNSVGASLYTRYTIRPTKTGRKANPGNIITCCKHIYGYVSFLLRRGGMSV